jgi:hypothetical protein
MKMYGGVDVQIHDFLTSALVGGEWSDSRPGRFTPGGKAPGTHWIGGWAGNRTGLDDMEKRNFLILPILEVRPLGRPTRSQSLFRLRYKRKPVQVPFDSVVTRFHCSLCVNKFPLIALNGTEL